MIAHLTYSRIPGTDDLLVRASLDPAPFYGTQWIEWRIALDLGADEWDAAPAARELSAGTRDAMRQAAIDAAVKVFTRCENGRTRARD